MKWIMIYLLVFSSIIFAKDGFIDYEIDGKIYEGYYTSPNINAPLVFLIHDWDGIGDYEIKRAKMLYDMGYATFAIDMYGKGVRPTELEVKKTLTSALYKDRVKMKKLYHAGIQKAIDIGANVKNAVALGYCFGGTVILDMARTGTEMKAFVSFHGGLTTPNGQNYKNINGEIFIFHGSADKVVGMNDFVDIAKKMEKNKIKHEMITYSGARHAYSVFGSDRYNERADKRSWQRFSEVLEEKLLIK